MGLFAISEDTEKPKNLATTDDELVLIMKKALHSDPIKRLSRKVFVGCSVLLITRILYGVQDFATHLVARSLALGVATVRERSDGVVRGTTPSRSRLHVWLRPFGRAGSTEPAYCAEFGAHRAPYETADDPSGTDSKSTLASLIALAKSSEGRKRIGGSTLDSGDAGESGIRNGRARR